MIYTIFLTSWYVLWCVGHGQTDTISAGEGEEHHDDDEGQVIGKEHRKQLTILHIAKHQERNKDHTRDHKGWKPFTLLLGLRKQK